MARCSGADGVETEDAAEALGNSERASAMLALAGRSAALAPALISVWRRRDVVSHPGMALAAVSVMVADLSWLAHRALAPPQPASVLKSPVVDTVGSVAALALAGGTGDPQVVSSFTVGLLLGSSSSLALTASIPAGLAGTAASTWVATLLAKRGKMLTNWEPLVGAAVAFYATGRLARYLARAEAERIGRLAKRRDDDRRGLEQLRTELAVQRERDAQHRVIHQHALQVLEMVAGDWDLSAECVRTHARRESEYLRRMIAGEDPWIVDGDLGRELRAVAEDFAPLGLAVELDISDECGEQEPVSCAALVHATREALINVRKHAAVDTAMLTAQLDDDGGVVVEIVDEGVGFDATVPGSGLRRDVLSLMEEVGGSASVDSRPGRGARVTLAVPSR